MNSSTGDLMKDIKTREFDVIVVGGGGAGLRFIPRDATSEEALEASFLKRLSSAFRGELKKTGDAGGGDGELGLDDVEVPPNLIVVGFVGLVFRHGVCNIRLTSLNKCADIPPIC